MGGRCSRHWPGVPNSKMAGPIIVKPCPASGAGALMRRISSSSTKLSAASRPPPPYSFGQVGAVQPRSAMRSSHSLVSGLAYTALRPPAV